MVKETTNRLVYSTHNAKKRVLMRDAVLVDATLTPIGKRNGALTDVHPVDLSARLLGDR
jgi:hypothetical protein